MKDLIETIRIEDGRYCNLGAHLERMSSSSLEAYGDSVLSGEVLPDIPEGMRTGTVKCRITYNTRITDVSFSQYAPRTIRSLKIVRCDSIDYHLKYADRRSLEKLLMSKSGCDDILIVRNGFVTDTSFSNVAFSDGHSLYIPDTCLLDGCMRRKLLTEGKAVTVPVRPSDILKYDKVFLINAMLSPGDCGIPVSSITF